MAKTTVEQVKHQLEQCQAILVALPHSPTIDALASALTLRAILELQEKKADIVCQDFTITPRVDFMPGIEHIATTMPSVQKFIVSVDKRRYPIADIGYTTSDDQLRIFITPKHGTLPTEAVHLSRGGFAYDLIVTINASELPALGAAYETQKTLFQTVPIINIDHRADNEHYGQINWIDIKATSTAELILSLWPATEPIEATHATAMLAGIMDETHSFRTPQVTPTTLETVSRLLKAGADHALVTQRLYRTKTVGALKLWGHILSHLQSDRTLSLAWSVIPASLLATTGAPTQTIQDLMTELLSHSPEARTVVLFIEAAPGTIDVQVSTKAPLHAKDLIKDWQPRGSERFAQATINGKTLSEAEQGVIAVVKQRLQFV